MDTGLMRSEGLIMAVVGVIILVIVVAAVAKGGSKGKSGCGWVIALIITGIIAYLSISGDVIKFSVP